ncbi:hypothetical protein FB451DRAFT_1455182 [Mycena latifolia]|nr:hypothetical protein FB451DRAFT_1455182 [Mycena latifolia]
MVRFDPVTTKTSISLPFPHLPLFVLSVAGRIFFAIHGGPTPKPVSGVYGVLIYQSTDDYRMFLLRTEPPFRAPLAGAPPWALCSRVPRSAPSPHCSSLSPAAPPPCSDSGAPPAPPALAPAPLWPLRLLRRPPAPQSHHALTSGGVSARYGAPHLHFACLRSRYSLKAPDDLPIAQRTICPKLRPYDPAYAGRSPRCVMRTPNSERGTSPIAPPPVRHHPLPSPCAYMYNAAAAPILAPLLSPVVRLLLVTPRFRALHLLVSAASNSALGRLVPGYRAPTVRLYSLHMPMHALTAASHLSTPVMTFERRTSKLVL